MHGVSSSFTAYAARSVRRIFPIKNAYSLENDEVCHRYVVLYGSTRTIRKWVSPNNRHLQTHHDSDDGRDGCTGITLALSFEHADYRLQLKSVFRERDGRPSCRMPPKPDLPLPSVQARKLSFIDICVTGICHLSLLFRISSARRSSCLLAHNCELMLLHVILCMKGITRKMSER